MKRLPFYKRPGKKGPLSGLKEKMAWQLSKRPMTGRELCEILDISLRDFNSVINTLMKQTAVAKFEATEWVLGEDGLQDRTYTLVRLRQCLPKAGKSIVVSVRSLSHCSEETRRKNRAAAKKRAKLIAAGVYRDHMG